THGIPRVAAWSAAPRRRLPPRVRSGRAPLRVSGRPLSRALWRGSGRSGVLCPEALADHVEGAAGPEPGDVLLGQAVAAPELLGRAVGVEEEAAHGCVGRQR